MSAGRGLGRLRALFAVLVAGMLAVAGLAACTGDADGWEDDSIAAYVGERGITEAEIDAVADDLRQEIGAEIERELERLGEGDTLTEQELADHAERRYGELEQQVSVNRVRTLEMTILTEAANRYAAEKGIEVPGPALEHHAFELGLSEESLYVEVVAKFFAVMAALQAEAEAIEPAESDQREVHSHLVEAGMTTTSFEEAQPVLTAELMGRQVAIRNFLREALDQAQVRVNPRYDLVYRVPVPVGSGESWLAVPLGSSDPAEG